MNTAPHETAVNRCCPTGWDASAPRLSGEIAPAPPPPATPAASAAKVKYVGALSRTLDSTPEAQKKCHGFVTPRLLPCSERNDMAGTMVMNTPTKITATS